MRSLGFRLMFFVAILWTSMDSTAWALGYHGETIETVYVMPSSVTLPIPTSYVVSSSWIEPTAYAVPTYYTTAYWMDPVVLAQPTYATTAYVRRGLFGRRWVVERPVLASYTTPYVPTAYYASPTYRATSYTVSDRVVVPTGYLASADCICPTTVASAAPTYRSPSASESPGAAAPRAGSRSRSLQSEPENLSAIDSNVPPAPADTSAAGAGGAPARDTTARETMPGTLPPDVPASGLRDNTPTPPPPRPAPPGGPAQNTQSSTNPPADQTKTATPGAGGAGQGGGAANDAKTKATPNAGGTNAGAGGGAGTVPPPTAPTAPADADPNAPPPIRRDSLRPSNYAASAVPLKYRNVLIGTVLSHTAGEPEEGVRISVRNSSSGGAKATTTDAFGRFAVRLSEGDWTVNVTMPSGRVYELTEIRVANGMITDTSGRRVPSLEITR